MLIHPPPVLSSGKERSEGARPERRKRRKPVIEGRRPPRKSTKGKRKRQKGKRSI